MRSATPATDVGRPRRRGTLAAVALMTMAAVAGCADEQEPTVDTPVGRPATPPDALPHVEDPSHAAVLIGVNPTSGRPVQLGRADVRVRVRQIDDGEVTKVDGPDGPGGALGLSFPAFKATGTYPRSGVVVSASGPGDPLSPADADFAYGADFLLDEVSTGRKEDNGNNLLQRGLSSDDIMFKLDIDADHRPGCTVKGEAGKLMVYARQPVEEGRWYHVHCEREADRLEVIVSEYLPSGQITTSGREAQGTVGSVVLEEPRTPLSIGAKAAKDGALITSATDQFNGRIANPFLIIQED